MSCGQKQKDRNLTTEIINVTINPKKGNKIIREGFIKRRSKERGKLNRKKEIEWKETKQRGKRRKTKRQKKKKKKINRKKENGN